MKNGRMMKKMGVKILVFLVMISAVIIIGIGSACGEMFTVDDDGEADYTSIGHAIENATNGDIIRVYDGDYHEKIVIDKSISVIGNGTSSTRIFGNENGTVVNITAPFVNLTGISVTGSGSEGDDAGIYIMGDHVSTRNCSASNNSGHGFYLIYSQDISMENCTANSNEKNGCSFNTIDHSTITSVYCEGNTEDGFNFQNCVYNEIRHCSAIDNQVEGINIQSGGNNSFHDVNASLNVARGFYIYGSWQHLSSCIINGNNVGVFGGGVYIRGDYITIENSEINDNHDFGIWITQQGYLTTVRNCSVSGNVDDGFWIMGADYIFIENCDILRNEEEGIDTQGSNFITVEGCNISYNTRNGINTWGYGEDCYEKILNSTIVGNGYRGIYFENTYKSGVYNTLVKDNDLGGITGYDDEILNCTITGNGGMGLFLQKEGAHVENCEIRNNEGNGVSFNYRTDVIDCNLSKNLYYGIRVGASNCIIRNITFTEEDTGLYLEGVKNTVISDCIFINSTLMINGDNINEFRDHIIENNSYNGKPYLYFSGQNDRTVKDDIGGLILADCSNFLIENVSFNGFFHGLPLYYCEDTVIRNSSFGLNEHGLHIDHCTNISISDCDASWNQIGITIISSVGIRIINATLLDNSRGCAITGSSDGHTIQYSNISRNEIGIYFSAYSQDRSHFTRNNISGNIKRGISYSDSSGKELDAVFNWWGNASGPYHDDKNPNGTGDNITGNVDFDPWAGKPKLVYNVNLSEYYYTIKDAIDAAEEDNVIFLQDGTYHENVVIDKKITLAGNGSKTTFINGNGEESVIRILTEGIHMKNLSIVADNPHSSYFGIEIRENNTIISRCKVSDQAMNGILIDGVSDNLILDCTIENNEGTGVSIISSERTEIEKCRISDHTYFNIEIRYSHYITIRNCEFGDSDDYIIFMDDCSNISVISSNISGKGHAGVRVAYCSLIHISGNFIDADKYGVYIKDSDACTIENNTITGNEYGIKVSLSSNEIDIHNNSIYSNILVGLDAQDNEQVSVNATENYWGHVFGPRHEDNEHGNGDNVTDNVIYEPWIGFRYYPVHNTDQDTYYDTISYAIENASEGDTIRIMDAVFHENLVIDKPLSIIGNGSGRSMLIGQEPEDIEDESINFVPVITIRANNVTLSGLDVEGLGYTLNQEHSYVIWGVGIAVVGNDSVIRDMVLTDHVTGIFAGAVSLDINTFDFGPWVGGRNLSLINNTFSDIAEDSLMHIFFAKTGITMFGIRNCTMKGNTFDGCSLEMRGEAGGHIIENNTMDDGVLTYIENEKGSGSVRGDMVGRSQTRGDQTGRSQERGDQAPENTRQLIVAQSDGLSFPDLYLPYGILMWDCDDIEVINCTIHSPSIGIRIELCSNITIVDCIITSTPTWGVGVTDSNYILIESCDLDGGGGSSSIVFTNTSDSSILGNDFSSWEYAGIELDDGSCQNLIVDNEFTEVGDGIIIDDQSMGNEIIGNSMNGPMDRGIDIYQSSDNKIMNNTITQCDWEAIAIGKGCEGTYLRNNTLYDNDEGIDIDDVTNITIIHCYIFLNEFGIRLYNTSDIFIHECDIYNNQDYGIYGGSGSVNATRNYWGDMSGPYHSSKNPDGEGDKAHGTGLDIDNWLLSPTDNEKPVAIILDISLNPSFEGDTVTFYGDGTDDGAIARYSWRSSLDGWLRNSTASNFQDSELSYGNHTIYLKVKDNWGIWSYETSMNLIIHGIPVPRIVSITPNPSEFGAPIHFQGNATGEATEEGQDLLWRWVSNHDGVLYSGPDSTINLDNLSLGRHTITLQVRNGKGIWSKVLGYYKEVVVSLHPIAYIDTINPVHVKDMENNTVMLEGHAVDDDGLQRYVWRSSIDGEFYNGSGNWVEISGLSKGVHTISFRALDGVGLWSEWVEFRYLIIDPPPVAEITSSPIESIPIGETAHLRGTGYDDGEVVAFEWNSSIQGLLYSGNQSSLDINFTIPGNSSISFRVQDDLGVWSEWVEVTFEVYAIAVARIHSIEPSIAEYGEEILFSAEPSEEIVWYEWMIDNDEILYNGSEPSFSYNDLSPGRYDISLRVKNVYDLWSQPVISILKIDDLIDPSITITSHKDRDTVEGIVIIKGTASDNYKIAHVEYRMGSDEEWNTIIGMKNWQFIWETHKLEDGIYTLIFRAFDGIHYSKSVNITLEVNNKGSEDDDSIMMKKIGPIPVIGMLILFLLICIGAIGYVMMKDGEKDGKEIISIEAEEKSREIDESDGIKEEMNSEVRNENDTEDKEMNSGEINENRDKCP